MSKGFAKAMDVLGDKIESLEYQLDFVRRQLDEEKERSEKHWSSFNKEYNRVLQLESELNEALEKIKVYEGTMILTEEGKPVYFKDLPYLNTTAEIDELIKESIEASK